MIVQPKVKGFICTTAHPKGCKESVRRQIETTRKFGKKQGPKRVLVIGSSTGYGLASRIAVAFGYGAATMGVAFEKEAKGKRTATAGYYNTKAFEEFAREEGLYAKSFNGDGFSEEMKQTVIEEIKKEWGQVDMVVYSLAAPRRVMPDGTKVTSVLKTVGKPITEKTIDLTSNQVLETTVDCATEEEIRATVQVMGGEDWKAWMEALSDADALAEGVITLAYSYIGPDVTHAIYKEGSIGQAKKDLYQTADFLNEQYSGVNLRAYVSVNKALVTQSSAAIPIVPLYISLLYRVMKDQGLHEGCIEQMNRLFLDKLVGEVPLDEERRIRLDDYEMKPEVQETVKELWKKADSDNIETIGDIEGYWEEFYHMFGFGYENVNYEEDVEL